MSGFIENILSTPLTHLKATPGTGRIGAILLQNLIDKTSKWCANPLLKVQLGIQLNLIDNTGRQMPV